MVNTQQISQQIQAIRQDLQSVIQLASQLQQSEQNNRAQLQHLQQVESMASQQLQRLQQVVSHIDREVSQINNLAVQQPQVQASGQYGGMWGTYGTGQSTPYMTGGAFAGGQPGPAASHFTGASPFAGSFAQQGSYAGASNVPYSTGSAFAQTLPHSMQFSQAVYPGSSQMGTTLERGGQWNPSGYIAQAGNYVPSNAGYQGMFTNM